MTLVPTFGTVRNYRLLARSRTALAQVPVGMPLRAAASSYAFLRALVSRISSLWSSGSSTGGRPLPLLGVSMGSIINVRTGIDKWESWVYSVRTVNQLS